MRKRPLGKRAIVLDMVFRYSKGRDRERFLGATADILRQKYLSPKNHKNVLAKFQELYAEQRSLGWPALSSTRSPTSENTCASGERR